MSPVDAVGGGGGMAGLAVAYHLTRMPDLSVALLKRELTLATHSSGTNAA